MLVIRDLNELLLVSILLTMALGVDIEARDPLVDGDRALEDEVDVLGLAAFVLEDGEGVLAHPGVVHFFKAVQDVFALHLGDLVVVGQHTLQTLSHGLERTREVVGELSNPHSFHRHELSDGSFLLRLRKDRI
jgi:hypothetical protein